MSFARLHTLVVYLAAGLGLWALSIGPYLEPAAQALIAIGLLASAFVPRALARDARWSRGWTVALIALFAVQIARGFGEASILSLALELTAALQVSRLFNRRGAAEHQQIAALALLMLIAATVLTTELRYALAFAGFLVVTPWMFALGHLRAEIEASHAGSPTADEDVARALASRRLVGPGFLAGTAALAIPLFAMTGLLFVVFPRVGLGVFSFGRELGQPVSGFGANVELGELGVIRTDPTVVLRVTPPNLGPAPAPSLPLRMRGTSFDHYDGRRWTRSRELVARTVGRHGTHYAIPLRIPNLRDEEWEIVLDPIEEPVIFLPPGTVGLRVPPRVVGSMDVGRTITVAPGIDVRYGEEDGLGLRYTAYTSPSAVYDPVLDPEHAQRYLQLPDGHERVVALAREWTRGAASDQERVARLAARLRDSGDFAYSLEMPAVGDRVPLDVFLFEARRGHCEYFATALAVMLRGVGVPARNATGFLGGRYNAYGGYYALSLGDAHSWVEAWLEGEGWVVVDPTPPARDAIAPDGGWLAAVREVLDAIRTRWASDVVSYDLRSQLRLFRGLREWLRGAAPEGEPAAEAAPGSAGRDRGGGARWPYAVVIGLALLVAGLVAWRRLRGGGRAAAAALDPDAARAVALLRTLDAALARLGRARPHARTAREHAARLTEEGFRESALVRRVVERYEAARFGGAALDAAEADSLARAARALGRRRDLAVPGAV